MVAGKFLANKILHRPPSRTSHLPDPLFSAFCVFDRVEEGTNFPLRGKGGKKKTDLLLEIYPSLNIETSPSGVFLPSVCLRK